MDHIAGGYEMTIDGCGALVAASADVNFDPGSGPLLFGGLPANAPNVAVARFAP